MKKILGSSLIFTVYIVISVNGAAKFAEARIAGSDVKQGGTTPVAISSRFLDLGGVISQLFSGFNQGSGGGGGAGLNLPPNSQFYPGVPAQNGNTQSYNNGNFWYPDQGSNQNGPSQNQQQWNTPNQNTLNTNNYLPPGPNQGWQNQNYGSNSNNQNQINKPYLQGPQGFQKPGQTTVPWYPNLGNTVNNGRGEGSSSNEGTLDDFFKNKNTTVNSNQRDESGETTLKTAIWGNKVIVPDTTPSDNIVFIDSSETPSQKECVQNCPTTSEYNPVCGTDDVTYFNPSRLICARNCGINVFEAPRGNCRRSG